MRSVTGDSRLVCHRFPRNLSFPPPPFFQNRHQWRVGGLSLTVTACPFSLSLLLSRADYTQGWGGAYLPPGTLFFLLSSSCGGVGEGLSRDGERRLHLVALPRLFAALWDNPVIALIKAKDSLLLAEALGTGRTFLTTLEVTADSMAQEGVKPLWQALAGSRPPVPGELWCQVHMNTELQH